MASQAGKKIYVFRSLTSSFFEYENESVAICHKQIQINFFKDIEA